MENRIPKYRYNGGSKPDDSNVMQEIEKQMDKSAAGIAQTVMDMFRFMSLSSSMLPNMELDVGIFCMKLDDEGVFFEITFPSDLRGKRKHHEDGKNTLPENNDDEEEGLIYDGD